MYHPCNVSNCGKVYLRVKYYTKVDFNYFQNQLLYMRELTHVGHVIATLFG